MMPYERMNDDIKRYVRNRARPDASIVQGFLADEIISLCMNFLGKDENPGLPVNKHLGRLDGYGHIEGKRLLHVDYECRRHDFDRANLVALQHLEVVDPWLEEHKSFLDRRRNNQRAQLSFHAVVQGEDHG